MQRFVCHVGKGLSVFPTRTSHLTQILTREDRLYRGCESVRGANAHLAIHLQAVMFMSKSREGIEARVGETDGTRWSGDSVVSLPPL